MIAVGAMALILYPPACGSAPDLQPSPEPAESMPASAEEPAEALVRHIDRIVREPPLTPVLGTGWYSVHRRFPQGAQAHRLHRSVLLRR